MIKIGIVGIGHISNFQIQAIEQSKKVILTDAYDIDPSKYKQLQKNVKTYASLESMLKNAQADIILVSVPNELHYEIGKEVIEAGRSVILEKPMCTSHDELDNLITLSKKHGQFIAIAFHAAYARDLNWWINHEKENQGQYGDLIGFSCSFFDPYIMEDGALSPMSKSLGGSWVDSGINALSVIGRMINPKDLSIDEARMTKTEHYQCDQIQGNAVVSFKRNGKNGFGAIDTNWTLGVNRKTTTLYYQHDIILLQHSEEKIYSIKNRERSLLKDLQNDNARLVNHYVALFDDLINKYETKKSNFDHSIELHRLLLDAKEKQDIHL
ncbi:MAG: Gfo/Idh/MocA family protein [Pseudomonadota bacterium]